MVDAPWLHSTTEAVIDIENFRCTEYIIGHLDGCRTESQTLRYNCDWLDIVPCTGGESRSSTEYVMLVPELEITKLRCIVAKATNV